ncbi:MAG: glycosyltransferase family 1 protein [Verrucomicrobiae bacterium]|nr:glycosyltransferase family 1 protein [Verrucomicrobiae bacterium]
MSMASKKVQVIVPFAPAIPIFRMPILKALQKRGAEVEVLAPDWTPRIRDFLAASGMKSQSYPLKRTGINPFDDIRTMLSLLRSFRISKPTLILTFQPKPNIYGIVAAALARVPKRMAVVEGLGFAFIDGDQTLKKRFVRVVLNTLYRISFSLSHKVFFLNPDDLSDFTSMGLVRPERAVLLGGIGVLLHEWPVAPPCLNPVTFTLVARLLKEKGIREFAAAARMMKNSHPGTRFLLIGPLDINPGAVSGSEVQNWVEDGIVEWVPWVDDVRPYLRETSVYVLPSYREGVPRSTQEAMAMARPVITTDVPGCRETVRHGVNGFLVPPRNVDALVGAMAQFVNDTKLIERMGLESRRMAEDRFDAEKVNEKMLQALGL